MRTYLQRLIAHIKGALLHTQEHIDEIESATTHSLNDLSDHISEVEKVSSAALNDLSEGLSDTDEVTAIALHNILRRINDTNEVTSYTLHNHEKRICECEKGGGGEGSAINVSMFVEYENTYSGSEFYIRCNKGEVKTTDQLGFARYVNKTGRANGQRWRYKGWIVPIARHCPKFTMSYVGYDQKRQKDVWKVNMLPFLGYDSLLSYCYAREIDREFDEKTTPKFKDCNCAFFVKREESRISNYVRFSIVYDSRKDVMSYAIK